MRFYDRRFYPKPISKQEKDMVDFAALRARAAQRLLEEHGNASTVVRYLPVKKTELEILQELLNDCSLNDWEESFCDSNIRWMTGKPEAKLSMKQKSCLDKMITKYEIDPEKHQDIAAAQNNNARAQAALDNIDDDDIPF